MNGTKNMYTLLTEDDILNHNHKIKDVKKIEIIINFFFILGISTYFLLGVYMFKDFTDIFNWDCYI